MKKYHNKKTINSTGYPHESKETITSYNTPSGSILDWYDNSKIVGVVRRLSNNNCSMVCRVMILMETPNSIRVFGMITSLMCTKTIKLSGS
jgi:hypothetical protein